MCGEKARVAHLVDTLPGSPPRVRGKVRHPQYTTSRGGITPACAGKSLSTRWTSLPYRDHPRVCGEKLAFSAFSARELGSPPRVRGKVGFIVLVQTAIGITPACAGKSFCWSLSRALKRDHPRVCGEKFCCSPAKAVAVGSPPRVRGKETAKVGTPVVRRITPACAGKSAMLDFLPLLLRDHPRVCGEKTKKIP